MQALCGLANYTDNRGVHEALSGVLTEVIIKLRSGHKLESGRADLKYG